MSKKKQNTADKKPVKKDLSDEEKGMEIPKKIADR